MTYKEKLKEFLSNKKDIDIDKITEHMCPAYYFVGAPDFDSEYAQCCDMKYCERCWDREYENEELDKYFKKENTNDI